MAEVQKVQLRFIDLGKKIGQGIMVKKQLGELTGRITRRDTGLAKLAKEIAAAAFDPEEAHKAEKAMVARPKQPCGTKKSSLPVPKGPWLY